MEGIYCLPSLHLIILQMLAFIFLGALQRLYSNFVFLDPTLGVNLIFYGPFGCHELCALVILWLFWPLPILKYTFVGNPKIRKTLPPMLDK